MRMPDLTDASVRSFHISMSTSHVVSSAQEWFFWKTLSDGEIYAGRLYMNLVQGHACLEFEVLQPIVSKRTWLLDIHVMTI
jgi:hypothetical protein